MRVGTYLHVPIEVYSLIVQSSRHVVYRVLNSVIFRDQIDQSRS